MTASKSPTVESVFRSGARVSVPSTRASRMAALGNQLEAAEAALGPTGHGTRDGALDEAAGRLHRVEDLLEELAADTDIDIATARQLRGLRDQVSVHLSAAASLRLLDLDTKAAAVLRRAIDSVRAPTEAFQCPDDGLPAFDAR